MRDGEIQEYEIHPEELGFAMASSRQLAVTDATESSQRVLEVLDNQAGVARDIVVLNAGAALYAANLAGSVAEGVALANEAIATGEARAKLDQFVAATQRLAG